MSTEDSSVVLVTGASSGIGRACALHLARRGFRVFAASRRPASDLSAMLKNEGGLSIRLETVTLDVKDASSVSAAVSRVLSEAGRLDAVVHCAGVGIGGAVEDTDDDEAASIFDTNFFGTLRVCRAALPAMRRQGSGALLIVSSIGGRIALPFQGLYSATKFAVEGLAESLSMEARGYGVRVVLIEPGDFCTGFTDRRSRVRRSGVSSAYSAAFERALAVIEADERGGSTPEPIARLVERLIASRRPRLRYTVGPFPQRLAVRLKTVLPGRAFERVLSLYYRLGGTRRAADAGNQGGRRG